MLVYWRVRCWVASADVYSQFLEYDFLGGRLQFTKRSPNMFRNFFTIFFAQKLRFRFRAKVCLFFLLRKSQAFLAASGIGRNQMIKKTPLCEAKKGNRSIGGMVTYRNVWYLEDHPS